VAAVGKTTSIVAPAAAAKTAPVVTPSVSSAQAKPENTVKPAPSVEALKGSELPKPEDKKWAMTGKRDPFFSPVVQGSSGSGCSTGKKCLEIGQINLRGVVKSENGFIAVVTNTLNKAYFLRENDPVFNGYVVKITGDSVVFQETVQDKLGKTFTREVVKKIFTPAV
jgi:Tfp pilus assembly protein PilP